MVEIDDKNQPDGVVFRRDSVDIVNHQDKVIHRGTLPGRVLPERWIEALAVLNDEMLEFFPIQIALFTIGWRL